MQEIHKGQTVNKTLYLIDPKYRKSSGLNPSSRYRAYHDLQATGGNGRIQFWDQAIGNTFETAVFIRPRKTNSFLNALHKLKKNRAVITADFDDLIFIPELSNRLPAVLNGNASPATIHKMAQQYHEALKYFSQLSVSTAGLVPWVRQVVPDAVIHIRPNHLPLYGAKMPCSLTTFEHRHEVHYFSGTRSHQHDLAFILPALRQWLDKNPEKTLVLRGSIRIPDKLKHCNVRHEPGCHYLAMGENLQRAMACIVPLQDTEFNQCKSAIKFLEAAQHGIPVIASPAGEYRTLTDGPLLANSNEEWFALLQKLAGNKRFWLEQSLQQQQTAWQYGLAPVHEKSMIQSAI